MRPWCGKFLNLTKRIAVMDLNQLLPVLYTTVSELQY